jgi:hypothetical protein
MIAYPQPQWGFRINAKVPQIKESTPQTPQRGLKEGLKLKVDFLKAGGRRRET